MRFALSALCGMMCAAAVAAERFEVWPDGRRPSLQPNQHAPFFLWHAPSALKTRSVLILVSGGGYYGNDISSFEVVQLRDYLLEKGMTVVTLQYRMPRPQGLPKHLPAWQDAQRTVRIVRKLAGERGLDTASIGFAGCSAGGHLAMLTAVSSMTKTYEPVDGLDSEPCNVNWAVPIYPAYLLTDGLDEQNVRRGNDLAERLAPELAFDKATPPMCFIHGDSDGWSAMGSVRACHRLRTMNIPVELHLLALEGHCFQLHRRPGTPAAAWLDTVWAWLVSLDIVTGHPATWRPEWQTPFPLWADKPLSALADFEPGGWQLTLWGGSVLAAEKDGALWLKGEWKDFVLDFEYQLPADAASGVIVGGRVVPMPSSVGRGRIEDWNRMTVRAEQSRLEVVVNGKPESVPELLRYEGACPRRGAVGFTGGKPGARPRFRNMHIRKL